MRLPIFFLLFLCFHFNSDEQRGGGGYKTRLERTAYRTRWFAALCNEPLGGFICIKRKKKSLNSAGNEQWKVKTSKNSHTRADALRELFPCWYSYTFFLSIIQSILNNYKKAANWLNSSVAHTTHNIEYGFVKKKSIKSENSLRLYKCRQVGRRHIHAYTP